MRQSVTLIGAGGIGSPTALVLAKMGCPQLTIYDPDEVSEENLATQLYPVWSLGRQKTSELHSLITEFSDDTSLWVVESYVDGSTALYGDIIISAVDSIAARQGIWEAVRESSADWYLDARMGAEVFQLYAVNLREGKKWYEDAIMAQSDETALEEPCTSKATIYTGFLASGHIGSTIRKIITGRPVPHFTVHNILGGVLLEV